MKILMANDYLGNYGGAEKVMFDLKKLLEKEGHQVALFGSDQADENFGSFFTRWLSLKNFFSSLKLINTFQPDIIHAHNVSRVISPSILLAAKIKKVPVVMTFHDYHLVCPKTWMIFADGQPCPYGFSAKCLISNCHTFNMGYKYFPYQWLKWLKVGLHRIIIRYTVNLAICPNLDLKRWIEQSLQLKTTYLPNFCNYQPQKRSNIHPKYFLYVGRLSSEKGVLNLINTFAKLDNDKLIIIGNGPEKNKLEKLVGDKKLEKRIKLLGAIKNDDLVNYYSQAYALIIPSLWKENNPLVALESLASGTPIIVSDRGGLVDFAHNGAISLSYRTEAELINCLQEIKKNKKTVSLPEIYSSKHFQKSITAIYSSLLLPPPAKSL